MNGYKAFWCGQSIEVFAPTSFAAQTKAAKMFGARKAFEVMVILCEKNGETVLHNPEEF